MGDERWKIGEVARRAGLTIRTLHHYEEIGLIGPVARSDSGHRLYGSGDIERLYVIAALRGLGMPLAEIAGSLSDRETVVDVLQRHFEMLERESEAQARVRARFASMLDAFRDERAVSTEDFLELLEVMRMHEKYYTPEQLAQLEQRRQELGEEGMAKAQQEWADLLADLEKERAKGTDPSDPKVQALAARSRELIEAFTGGDPGIAASLKNMYEQEGVERASRGFVNPELMEYLHRANSS